jgi:hypothetical protein
MSDIPKAREILLTTLQMFDLDPVVRRRIHAALALMTREKAIRRAKGSRSNLDNPTRRKIRNLSLTDMTMHEIADAVGLHNIGRVSEVLNRKR